MSKVSVNGCEKAMFFWLADGRYTKFRNFMSIFINKFSLRLVKQGKIVYNI